MLLRCETEHGAPATGAPTTAVWLGPETLASLLELNEACLALLAEQAEVRGAAASALLRQIGEQWRALDAAARRRAAGCPYLLLDAGFADPLRWRLPSAPQVGDAGHGYSAFFSVPAAADVARLVFTYAWHLARTHSSAARLLLGMSAPSSALIGQYTLCQIQALAQRHCGWLRPRWPAHVVWWRELLLAAASDAMPSLERARLRGLTLLAAETRLTPPLPTRAAPQHAERRN